MEKIEKVLKYLMTKSGRSRKKIKRKINIKTNTNGEDGKNMTLEIIIVDNFFISILCAFV